MGRYDQSIAGRPHDALNAHQALSQILPALKITAKFPEKFSERERAIIVELLYVAMVSDDTKLATHATEVVLALEAQNQRQSRQEWTTQKWADNMGRAKSTVVETETWKSLSLLRQQAKAERRKDRRGTKPV